MPLVNMSGIQRKKWRKEERSDKKLERRGQISKSHFSQLRNLDFYPENNRGFSRRSPTQSDPLQKDHSGDRGK